METDRELLDLAAKAVGIMLEWDGPTEYWQPMYYEGKTYKAFNPLEDDGDAFRLAVKLRIMVDPDGETYAVANACPKGRGQLSVCVKHNDDPYAATRRAITRAAAEIYKSSLR